MKNKLKRITYKRELSKKEMLILDEYSKFLGQCTFIEQKYCYLHDIHERELCPICGNKLRIKDVNKGFQTFCSRDCMRDPKAKIILNIKTKITCREKYGVDYPQQSVDIKNKSQQSCIEKYGVDNFAKSKEFKSEMRNWWSTLSETDRRNIQQSKEQTWQTTRGVNHVWQKESKSREKGLQTIKENYDDGEISNRTQITNRTNFWDKYLLLLREKLIEPKFTKEEYVLNTHTNEYICLKCNRTFISEKIHPQGITCSYCKKSVSNYEIEIRDWLSELGISNVKYNYRRKYELDFYLEGYNLGIEFHGLYWHSELHKDKFYHQKKWAYFNEMGIEVIQIFENEWVHMSHIIKSIIKKKLNITNYVSNFIIKEVDSSEYLKFAKSNSLYFVEAGSITLGIYASDGLMEIISMNPKEDECWEVISHISRVNYHVNDSMSHLIKFIKSEYSCVGIQMKVDLRFGDDNMNLSEIELLDPNCYWWEKNSTQLTRKCNNDFFKIYDAGEKLLTELF